MFCTMGRTRSDETMSTGHFILKFLVLESDLGVMTTGIGSTETP